MKFLADESCDFAVVRALRKASYEVIAIGEIASGEADENIIKMAVKEKRILITEDRDFGELVYAHQQKHGGIILIRYPSMARKEMAEAVCNLVQEKGESLVGCFVVVSPAKIRIKSKM